MTSVRTLLLALACFTASVAAQRPEPVALPRLMQLGPMPADAAVMILTRDGRLAKPSKQQAAPEVVLLRIDRETPLSGVRKLLEKLRTGGTTTVLFAATLPDGTAGCFTLALPADPEANATIDLRLHRERVGVPPTSVVPLLRRMQAGVTETPFVVAVEAPADAPFEAVLQIVAAAQQAGVPGVILRAGGAGGRRPAEVDGGLGSLARALGGKAASDAQQERSAGFAIDLLPRPRIAVSARALPQDRPAVRAEPVGCLVAAPVREVEAFGGGAGGRYGGRGGGGKRAAGVGANIQAGAAWLDRQQAADGSFARDDGSPDLAATALVMLALLGDGVTLRAGSRPEMLGRGIGWILDRQEEDGGFALPGPGSLRQHALATYALAEAYGLSNEPLLRGSLQDAIAWIGARRNGDGGFGDGTPGAESDSTSTALALMALASAWFFAIELPVTPGEVVGWFEKFDAAPDPPATETGAALFCRFFAGLDPKATPAMGRAAGRLVEDADPEDPWCAYWTTYGLYQMGGADWQAWSKALAEIADRQITEGELAGSWAPSGGNSRAVTTALYVLTLEAYYRYTRIIR